MTMYSEVKGVDVVTQGEGKKVGTVSDAIINVENWRVARLRLESGSLFGRGVRCLPVDAVRVGDDHVLTVGSEADLREDQEGDLPRGLVSSERDLIGKRAISENGNRLGKVLDYSFAPNGWVLVNILLAVGETLVAPDTYDLDVHQYAVTVTDDAVIAGKPENRET